MGPQRNPNAKRGRHPDTDRHGEHVCRTRRGVLTAPELRERLRPPEVPPVSRHKSHTKKPSEHVFRYEAPDAQRVVVTGSFCDWDPERHVLTRHGVGHWETRVPLVHGRHEYRFVVDGSWVNDPACGDTVPTPFGCDNNSVDV